MAGPDGGMTGRWWRIGACVALAFGIAVVAGLWRDEGVDLAVADRAKSARPGIIVLKVFGPVLY